jgi:hypothetical protein
MTCDMAAGSDSIVADWVGADEADFGIVGSGRFVLLRLGLEAQRFATLCLLLLLLRLLLAVVL